MAITRCPFCRTLNKDKTAKDKCDKCGRIMVNNAKNKMVLIYAITFSIFSFVVMTGACVHAFTGKSQDLLNGEKQLRELRTSLDKLKVQYEDRKRSTNETLNKTKILEQDYTSKKKEIDEKKEMIHKIEDEMHKKVSEARQKRDKQRELIEKEVKIVKDEYIRQKDDEIRAELIKKILQDYKFIVVTVAASKTEIGTGIFFEVNRQMQIVTSASLVKGTNDVVIKMFYRLENKRDQNHYSGVAIGKVVYRDAPSGLAFVTITRFPRNGILMSTFVKNALKEPKVGEDAYSLAAQVLGDALLEHNVFDGNISAKSRSLNGMDLMQTTFPTNRGMRGAPIIDGNGNLTGILLGKLADLEKTSFAVSGLEIYKAIERAEKAGNR